jgi:hypothetical protein
MSRARKTAILFALVVAGGTAIVALLPARSLRAEPKPVICNGVTCRPNEICCIDNCPPVQTCVPKAGKGVCPPLRPCPEPIGPPQSSQN